MKQARGSIKLLVASLAVVYCLSFGAQNTAQDNTQPISSRIAFLRAQRAAAALRQARNEPQTRNETSPSPAPSTPISVSPPKQAAKSEAPAALLRADSMASSTSSNTTSEPDRAATNAQPPSSPIAHSNSTSQVDVASNRSTRTVDSPQTGDSSNIFVTNTCERELMRVNIKTNRPFFGVIHTRNQRQRRQCHVEGNGDTEYNLDISHTLNQQDPAFCGVIKASRESAGDQELLSVVLAVRVHRNIELSEDKFFLLNCTNRCRRADCSTPTARLTDDQSGLLIDGEIVERKNSNAVKEANRVDVKGTQDDCTVWKFPWLIAALWCLAVLTLALLISHCIMCSSVVCRCTKTEVAERESSVLEGATDLEDDDSFYSKRTHPMRIDYDNRDIYKTSNNYKPYTLAQDQDTDSTERSRPVSATKERRKGIKK